MIEYCCASFSLTDLTFINIKLQYIIHFLILFTNKILQII